MPHICYLAHQKHAELQRDTKGIAPLHNPEEISKRIRKEWRHWDYIQEGEKKNRRDYYQDPVTHCNSVILTDLRDITGKSEDKLEDLPIIHIRFSSPERAILELMLRDLGLPTEKISNNDIGYD